MLISKRCVLSSVVLLGVMVTAAAAGLKEDPTSAGRLKTGRKVEVVTTEGRFVIELWPEKAPETVANFVRLVENGFYDGTRFYRIIRGIMIEAGDPLSRSVAKKEEWGTGELGYGVPVENAEGPHLRGAVCMARPISSQSSACRFFVCLQTLPYLQGGYTIFGQVVDGLDVVDRIGRLQTEWNAFGTEKSVPVRDVRIEQIRLIE